MNNVISRNGALYCFCEEEIKHEGSDRFKSYTLDYTDGNTVGTLEAPICKIYYQYMTGLGYIV